MIEIKLTKEELKIIEIALVNLPYGQVYKVIGNISKQVEEQTVT